MISVLSYCREHIFKMISLTLFYDSKE